MRFNIIFIFIALLVSSTACLGIKKSEILSSGEIELSGKFESKKGVKHKISCYG